MAKFICDHCGEVVESGLENILNHQFETCKAITYEKPEGNNGISVKSMPFLLLSPVNETNQQNQ